MLFPTSGWNGNKLSQVIREHGVLAAAEVLLRCLDLLLGCRAVVFGLVLEGLFAVGLLFALLVLAGRQIGLGGRLDGGAPRAVARSLGGARSAPSSPRSSARPCAGPRPGLPGEPSCGSTSTSARTLVTAPRMVARSGPARLRAGEIQGHTVVCSSASWAPCATAARAPQNRVNSIELPGREIFRPGPMSSKSLTVPLSGWCQFICSRGRELHRPRKRSDAEERARDPPSVHPAGPPFPTPAGASPAQPVAGPDRPSPATLRRAANFMPSAAHAVAWQVLFQRHRGVSVGTVEFGGRSIGPLTRKVAVNESSGNAGDRPDPSRSGPSRSPRDGLPRGTVLAFA